MRNLLDYNIDRYRARGPAVISWFGSEGDSTCGMFYMPSPIDRATLRIIASSGMGWDHVSVSRNNRCPNWVEMDHVKRIFFRPDEVAMQLHVAESEHISAHDYCLHIWRPHDVPIPLPPSIMVAPDEFKAAP